MTNRSSPQVLALIPARSGSKSIPDKNLRLAGGKPLLAWSVDHALRSRRVTRTLVSTDSERYASVARLHGAEVPFLRPGRYAQDRSTDLEVFLHALEWLDRYEGFRPDLCVHLRPTCPIRDPAMIDAMVDLLDARPELDSVRTVTPVVHPPFKMWYRDPDGELAPVAVVEGLEESWNQPRQRLPETFLQTANIDVVRTRVILEQHSMTGRRIHGFLDAACHDIDTLQEFERAAGRLEQADSCPPVLAAPPVESGRRVFCFDIDGVIATLSPGNDYRRAWPRREVVQVIRRLHESGHRIILFTARGSRTGVDWRGLTEAQMRQWGVPYHELRFGKPAADHYIDDRMVSLEDLKALAERVAAVPT